jgi:hypothetical protein
MKKEKQTQHKKEYRREEPDKKFPKIASLILLVIMLFSIGGFALSMSGGSGGATNPEDLQEVPFQQFQDPNSGQVFWGAIRNSEQFIFLNITGFDERQDLKVLSDEIKSTESVKVYYGEGVLSSVPFLLERTLLGIRKDFEVIETPSCEAGVLLIETQSTINGACMNLEVGLSLESQNKETEILSYFLIQ